MRKSDVSQRLYEKLDSDPDLKYYLDDENIIKLVGKLIEGIGEVIEENNKRLSDDLLRGVSRVVEIKIFGAKQRKGLMDDLWFYFGSKKFENLK